MEGEIPAWNSGRGAEAVGEGGAFSSALPLTLQPPVGRLQRCTVSYNQPVAGSQHVHLTKLQRSSQD